MTSTSIIPDDRVHLPRNESPPDAASERRAAALADIQKMHEDLNTAHETIGQLRADLHREEDRCVMLIEERDRYRHEALVFRSKLIELATQMANIGLLTQGAQDVMHTVHELTTETRTPTKEILDNLEHQLGGPKNDA